MNILPSYLYSKFKNHHNTRQWQSQYNAITEGNHFALDATFIDKVLGTGEITPDDSIHFLSFQKFIILNNG